MNVDAGQRPAADAADSIATHLATPHPAPTGAHGRGASLAHGTVGIALLHIERAHAETGGWRTAHTWLTAAADAGYSGASTSSLYLDLPALAFVVHTANADGTGRYQQERADLDARVTMLAHRRVDAAHARIARGELPTMAEYDLLHGLTGIGAHLLRHHPDSDALGRILTYLVHLTRPIVDDGQALPGWWANHAPNIDQPGAGGHANFGIAHGITGPLSLLALALRQGVSVEGHREAIATILRWLDRWQQTGPTGPWWPQWITRSDLHLGNPAQSRPSRPSWCYGTPGIARAQQHAAIATADQTRQHTAEHALTACICDPIQLATITDIGLCHGWAGVHQTAWRAAADALTPGLAAQLPHLRDHLLRHHTTTPADQLGFLDGAAGVGLALHTAGQNRPPVTGWDACLLLT